MPNYAVQDRSTGEIVHAYTADQPSHANVYPAVQMLEQVGLIAAGRAAEILA